jgi:hypothetical protein
LKPLKLPRKDDSLKLGSGLGKECNGIEAASWWNEEKGTVVFGSEAELVVKWG